jgi:hypothetical protein
MSWKEFLKPNKKKILATLIILFIIALAPTVFIALMGSGSLQENLQGTLDFFPALLVLPFWFPVWQFGLYQCGSCAYLKDTEYVVCANGEKLGTMCSCISKLCINWPYILLNVLFWIFFAYLISCLLFREGMPKKQVKRKG